MGKESYHEEEGNDVDEQDFVIEVPVGEDVSAIHVEGEGHDSERCVGEGYSADNEVHVPQPCAPPTMPIMEEAAK